MKNVTGAIVPRTTEAAATSGLLAVRSPNGLVPHRRPDPDTANGYLRLTAHLLVEAGIRRFRTIGVASPADGEGSTAAALNLAICFGRTRGREGRVLLVDGDAHRCTMTDLLRTSSRGPVKDGSLCGPLHTPFEGVDFLPALRSADPLALDTPWSWIRRLEDFGGDYAHIVVDCPSVLDAPDGRLVGECVDGIVLVVRAGVTKARDVERAARGFEGRILGVVLGDDTGSRKRRA